MKAAHGLSASFTGHFPCKPFCPLEPEWEDEVRVRPFNRTHPRLTGMKRATSPQTRLTGPLAALGHMEHRSGQWWDEMSCPEGSDLNELTVHTDTRWPSQCPFTQGVRSVHTKNHCAHGSMMKWWYQMAISPYNDKHDDHRPKNVNQFLIHFGLYNSGMKLRICSLKNEEMYFKETFIWWFCWWGCAHCVSHLTSSSL